MAKGRPKPLDRYVAGFLAGQTVAYCEAINFGTRVAGQIACPREHAAALVRLVRAEGCKAAVERVNAHRCAIWIYRDRGVKRLIDRLRSGGASAVTVWSMGKLFGYADRAVVRYIERAT